MYVFQGIPRSLCNQIDRTQIQKREGGMCSILIRADNGPPRVAAATVGEDWGMSGIRKSHEAPIVACLRVGLGNSPNTNAPSTLQAKSF